MPQVRVSEIGGLPLSASRTRCRMIVVRGKGIRSGWWVCTPENQACGRRDVRLLVAMEASRRREEEKHINIENGCPLIGASGHLGRGSILRAQLKELAASS